MKITPQRDPSITADAPGTPANRPINERVTTQVVALNGPPPFATASTRPPISSPDAKRAPGVDAATAPATEVRKTAVTFRRDSEGHVFYVVSDAHSGAEILEVPPKTVREVGQGIEDYLKSQESKATASPRLEVKG
jgi:hypothetical protein